MHPEDNHESPESKRGISFKVAAGIFLVTGIVVNVLLEATGEKHGLARDIAIQWFGFTDYSTTETTTVVESVREVTETTKLISKEFQAGVVLGTVAGAAVVLLYRFLTRRQGK